MCAECHQNPHAHTCPNNPNYDDERTVTCPLCGREYDEEAMTESVCASCLEKNSNYETALEYGAERKTSIELNGFLAYAFSVEEIEDALKQILSEASALPMPTSGEFVAVEYCFDDASDFADWLIERKNKY